ncbi:hypothetical protein DER45DRAFT_599493 [Fusarium avenaceum]|nr:hypothetical protein DER45DRAFT_599493 [Fusarium avenaceum]
MITNLVPRGKKRPSEAKENEIQEKRLRDASIPPVGLTTLIDIDALSTNAVDLVAVHGLGGHPKKTWRHAETGAFWLEQFIPQDIKNARVMTYGYKSDVAFSQSTAGVEDFAIDLLARLEIARKDKSKRPIIFICHSMGGLIVKKALILAHDRQQIYNTIAESKVGIVFLATPHQGSGLAALGQLASLQDLHSKVTLRDPHPIPSDQATVKIVSTPTSRPVEIKAAVNNKQIQQFYKSNYMEYKASVKPPIKDTFSWFLQEPQYITWLESPVSSLLWVSGDPGCGKTTLASFLVNSINQYLILGDNDFIVTYFFFNGNNFADQVDGTALLFALIHQLIQADPALAPLVKKYLALDHTQSRLNLGKLCEIFRAIVSTPERKHGRIVCVMDALDECDEESITKIIRFLNSIVFDDSNSASRGGWLKVVITSRYNQHIFRFLPSHQQIRLADHAESTTQDIATFVYMVLDLLETNTDASLESFEAVLRPIPDRLDGLYNSILQRTRSRHELLRILSIIAASQRALTLDEIDIALAVRPGDSNIRQVQHRYTPDIAGYLYALYGPFIRIWNGTVSFIHQTATEFLLRSAEKPESTVNDSIHPYKACLDMVGVNQHLAEICIMYLTLDDAMSDGRLSDHGAASNTLYRYDGGSNNENGPIVQDTKSLTCRKSGKGAGLFDYAAKYWGTHCRLGSVTSSTSSVSCENSTIFTKTIALCDTSTSTFRNWFQLYWNTISTIPQFPDGLTSLMIASHMGLPDVMRILLLADGNWKNKTLLISTSTTTRSRASHLRTADSEGWTALHWAVWNGHGSRINNDAIAVLLQQLHDDYRVCSIYRTPHKNDLHYNNHESDPDQQCQTTETNTAILDIQDNKGMTPLHWAAADDQTGVVRLLLEAGAAVDVFDAESMTPLLLAYENGFIGPLELLVEYGADVNVPYGEP